MKTYLTQDNGAEPFKVEITDNHVVVYKFIRDDNDYEDYCGDYQRLVTYDAVRVFVGKSLLNGMTAFSGGHGDKYDGNSILLELPNNLYVHIGRSIFSFTPKALIVSYLSPVGNNWVPYPYAVDELNNYYLMTEDVILLNGIYRGNNTGEILNKLISNGDDPYSYYYNQNKILDWGYRRDSPPINPTGFMDITGYFLDMENGLDTYTFRYNPDTPKEREWNFPKDRKKDHYICIGGENTRISLSERMYWEIMAAFGKMIGFEPLQKTIIA